MCQIVKLSVSVMFAKLSISMCSIFIFQMDLKDAKLECHVMSSKVEMYSDHFHHDVVLCMHL